MDIATRRADGTLRKPRIVWVVRLGDGLYVRSVNGPDAAWYRGTRTRMQGHIQAGGLDTDVTFVDADHGLDDAIDDAYRTKYRGSPVGRQPHHQRAGARHHHRARAEPGPIADHVDRAAGDSAADLDDSDLFGEGFEVACVQFWSGRPARCPETAGPSPRAAPR